MARDLDGRLFLITGANAGIGRATAEALARRGAHLVLACRSKERTAPVIEAIKRESGNDAVDFLELDLGSLAAVRRSAETFLARDLPLHVLINNAGLAGASGTTVDGFETTFGVNHLGHFLFTLLLLPRVLDSTPARIVNVASRAHTRTHGIDFDALQKPTATTTGFPEYQVSKLANVMFTIELARRLQGKGVNVYSLHPGVIASSIWREVPWPIRPLMKLFMDSNEEGAKTTLYCATSEAVADQTGLYYSDCKVAKMNPVAEDEAVVRKLWDLSVEWTGEYLGGVEVPPET